MCLALLALEQSAELPFILAVNRDEFFARPTKTAYWWEDVPQIFGGRDLERGGTWLGVTRAGRLAFVTNIREGNPGKAPRSRGELVANFLRSESDALAFLESVRGISREYLGFNLILGNIGGSLYHFSNSTDRITPLSRGVHGLSNADLNTPWPKVQRSKEALSKLFHEGRVSAENLFQLLQDRRLAADGELPATGIPLEWERKLSAVCIDDAAHDYGTRSSSVILFTEPGELQFEERSRPSTAAGFEAAAAAQWRRNR